jgi:hypothetical protein
MYGDNVIKFSASTTNFNSFTGGNKNKTIQFLSGDRGIGKKVFRVHDDLKIISTVSKDTLVYKAIRKSSSASSHVINMTGASC